MHGYGYVFFTYAEVISVSNIETVVLYGLPLTGSCFSKKNKQTNKQIKTKQKAKQSDKTKIYATQTTTTTKTA